jgi:hypothetical protein
VTSPTAAPTTETVEALVRARLSEALGGRRGLVEGALPTLAFTVMFVVTHALRSSLAVGAGLAGVLLVLRIVQRQTPKFVVNALVGIAIAAAFALRSGNARDVFLPGIIYNAVYAVLISLSIIVRWPIVGLMIGSITGDPAGWREDRSLVRLCSRLSWLLVLPCAVRVAVQYPLYLAGRVGWLGTSKIVLGWPLQVAALAAMAYLLSRNRTPHTDAAPTS